MENYVSQPFPMADFYPLLAKRRFSHLALPPCSNPRSEIGDGVFDGFYRNVGHIAAECPDG
jgi:hypothetical protein